MGIVVVLRWTLVVVLAVVVPPPPLLSLFWFSSIHLLSSLGKFFLVFWNSIPTLFSGFLSILGVGVVGVLASGVLEVVVVVKHNPRFSFFQLISIYFLTQKHYWWWLAVGVSWWKLRSLLM